jgi:hypothetical protein
VSGLRANRRQVLAGAGAALAGGAFNPGGNEADRDNGADLAAATVILQDPRHALPEMVRRRLADNGARLLQLESDPVRQWRGGAAALLTGRATRLLGVTRWPEFLLVRGLAEESGRRVRYQRFDPATGTIVWLMA